MRRGTFIILAGSLLLSLETAPAVAEEPQVIQQLPDRPDLRRERVGKNAHVFRLLPTWQKSAGDPHQETKANKSHPFRLLTLRDKASPEIRQFADRQDSKADRDDDEHSKIYRLLSKRISVEFKETALADVLKRLGTRCDVNIFIDPRGMEDAGVSSDLKISIAAQGTRLSTLLDRILLPLHLDYAVAHEVIKVTGQQQAKGELTTRTYAVAGLAPKPADGRAPAAPLPLDLWPEQLREQICPATWEEAGGQGSIVLYATTASLVVRQTADVHEELALYLNSLTEDDLEPADDLESADGDDE